MLFIGGFFAYQKRKRGSLISSYPISGLFSFQNTAKSSFAKRKKILEKLKLS